MTKTWQLRALGLYLTLGIPLAASCAREANTLEGDDDDTSMDGGTTAKAGTTNKAGTTAKAGTTGAFGGTGGSGAGGKTGTAGSAVAEGGDSGTTAGSANMAGKGGSGTAGGGGAGGSAGVPPDVLARASAIVYYETSHATAMDKTIQMKLHVKNQSADPLPMANVKIRYWFTAEAPAELHQYYTGPEAKLPKAVFVSAGNDSHALLTFGGGSIVKGGDMNASEIQLEITNNTTPFNQADDFSWNPADIAATPNDKITLYLDDVLIWGCEPSGKCFGDGAGGAGAGGATGAGGAP